MNRCFEVFGREKNTWHSTWCIAWPFNYGQYFFLKRVGPTPLNLDPPLIFRQYDTQSVNRIESRFAVWLHEVCVWWKLYAMKQEFGRWPLRCGTAALRHCGTAALRRCGEAILLVATSLHGDGKCMASKLAFTFNLISCWKISCVEWRNPTQLRFSAFLLVETCLLWVVSN